MSWRYIVFVLLVLAALAGASVLMFQRQIGEMLFRQAADDTIGRDRTSDLPDGLHVFVCGSGSPMPDPDRAGPCLGVIAGKRAFLVDVGSGGPRRLARMGFPVGRIERVYLTHLHSDHFDSLGELMLQAWIGGSRSRPLPVAGPEGVEEVVAGFNAAYRIDSTYRTAHHGAAIADPAGFGGVAEVIPAPNSPERRSVILEDGDLRLTVIAVHHEPVSPAFGFRIDYKDRSVVISGDTAYSADLAAAAKGVDVMLHEALRPQMVAVMRDAAAARGADALAKVMADIPDYHASPEAAARTARQAGARALVLYHLVPPLPSPLLEAAFIGDAAAVFGQPVELARDGLMISLPSGQTAIHRSVIR